uniref:Gsp_11 putative toxin n=1 Tax=Gemmula speciosa TaxID=439592 RepID=A0A098LW98_GEMSP
MRMSLCLLVSVIVVTAGEGVSTTGGESQAHGYSTERNTDTEYEPCQGGNRICGTELSGVLNATLCTCPLTDRCPFDNDEHRITVSNSDMFNRLYSCKPIYRYRECTGPGVVAITAGLNKMKCRCKYQEYHLDDSTFRVECIS